MLLLTRLKLYKDRSSLCHLVSSEACQAHLKSTALYSKLAEVRKLRNRIARHEPIFTRQLADDYRRVLSLVRYRCKVTEAWLNKNQQAFSINRLKVLKFTWRHVSESTWAEHT